MTEKQSDPNHEMKRVAFEVYGKVQGVFFRAGTIEYAKSQNLTGWVKNSTKNQNIVEGEAQGSPTALELLKKWLSPGGDHPGRVAERRKWQEIPVVENELEFEKKH